MWQRWSPLQIALGISVLVHGMLLSLRVADPERFDRLFQTSPLEVILVNTKAKSSETTEPQALAQTRLAGGGDAEQGRARSPLPSAALSTDGDQLEPSAAETLAALRLKQSILLSQVKASLALLPETQNLPDRAQALAQEAKRQQLLKLLAEIEQRIEQDNAKPRKRYISPSTQEAIYAQYYDNLRRLIEAHGTRYFPQLNGQKLYGELTMVITVNALGQVLTAEVVNSSGQRALDLRAVAIVRSAGPFGAFDPLLRKSVDQLAMVARFQFSRDGSVLTH
jgi:periplasmic protein TonB